MDSYKKLFTNTFWFAVGNFGSKFLTFILLPIYTTYLTKDEFGIVDILNTTIYLIVPVFSLQIFNSVLRFSIDDKEDKEKIFTSSIIFITVSFVATLVILPLIQDYLPFKDYAIYFYLLIFLRIYLSTLQNFLKAINKVNILAISGIIETFFVLLLSILLLVYLDLGVDGYLLTLISGNVAALFFVLVSGHIVKYIKPSKFSMSSLKLMLLYSVPLVPNAVSLWFMNLSDRYMINIFLGLTANGIYAVANRIPALIQLLYTVFYNAWTISGIENFTVEKKEKFYSNIYNLLFVVLAVGVSLLLILLKPIMSLLVNEAFFESWRYVPFLLAGVMFSSLSGFFGVIYLAVKKTGGVLLTSLFGAVLNIVINIFLIPVIGIQAASLSTMIAFGLVWIMRLIQTKKYIAIQFNLPGTIISILLLGLQIFIVLADYQYAIIIQVPVLLLILVFNKKIILSVKNEGMILLKNYFNKSKS